jgi:hypothetical protein
MQKIVRDREARFSAKNDFFIKPFCKLFISCSRCTSKNNEDVEVEENSKAIENEEVPEPVQHIEISENSETYQELNSNANVTLPVNSHEIEKINSTTTGSRSNLQSKFNEECKTNTNGKNVTDSKSVRTISQKSRHFNEDNKQITELSLSYKWPTHATIGSLKLQFPHFNIGPTYINATDRYSVSNTCSLDSSLFLLYYIYISHSEDFRFLFDPDIRACDNLRKTFDLVERKGWDMARLYWITVNSVYSKPEAKNAHIDLYGTADTNCFQFVREIQKYVIESSCTCTDCPKLVRQSHSVDISLP